MSDDNFNGCEEPMLSLNRLLQEGRDTAARTARAILRRIGKTGVVDFNLLDRLGPEVRRQLVSQMAQQMLPARPKNEQPKAKRPAEHTQAQAIKAPGANAARSGAVKPADPERAYRHWRDQRRPLPDLQRDAASFGVLLALSFALIACFGLAYFKF